MLKFSEINRTPPDKRAVADRVTDFREIDVALSNDALKSQSSRCSQCGVPLCSKGCPLGNHIPEWLEKANLGFMEEAYQISSETNTLPEVCGRICPQDRLCENSCVIEPGFGAVTIGAIEKHITDFAWENGFIKPIVPASEQNKKIAIIGSGPAGIAGAHKLREMGYHVTIFDRYDRGGGLLTYGIPSFKLEKHIVERRMEWLQSSGVSLRLSCEVGKNVSFSELRKEFNAVLIATGVYKPQTLNMPNASTIQALDFLTHSNRLNLNSNQTDPKLDAKEKTVIVIGGGDTAMDCVRTAVRQGAKVVTCVYRRDRNSMPGSRKEIDCAEQEGVEFLWLTTPIGFKKNGTKPQEIIFEKMRLVGTDPSGRPRPVPIAGSQFTLQADMVIEALGFKPEDLPKMFDAPELEVSKSGTLSANARMQTSLDGVFAAGDIVRGASLVVWAIKDGRDAAKHIHHYLSKECH